jgi:hypothetical protein
MEFLSPSTLQPRRVHSTPACLTGYVPPTGFHTLSTACSSPRRPALFRAGNAHGVFRSPGVYPHCQVPWLVATKLPSWRFSAHQRYCRCEAPVSTRRNALLGPLPPPRPCSDSESVPSPDCYILGNGRSPPELRSPLQGIAHAHRPRHALREPLLRFACLELRVRPRASSRPSAKTSSSDPGQAQNRPQTPSSSNHETNPRSSTDDVFVQPRDEPAVVLGRCLLPTTGRARDRPQTDRMRSSGFARKRGISLRGAKYPLLRFEAFLLQSLVERRPTQCADGQPTHSAFGHTNNASPLAS